MATQRDQAYDLGDPMFATDDFRCFRYKVELCPRGRPHDWTQCPYAHPQEKAKRRDPKQFKYSGTACQTFRKNGSCERGDSCPYAHGVFECWLHPARYRTQMCTDGKSCNRRVCFFAHDESEIRTQPVDANSADGDTGEKAEFSSADVPMLLDALKKLLASQSNDSSTQALQRGVTSLLAQQQKQQTPAPQQQLQQQPSVSSSLQVPVSVEMDSDFLGCGASQPLIQQLVQNPELRHSLVQALIEQEVNRDQQLFDRNLYLSQNQHDSDNLDPLVMACASSNGMMDVVPGMPQMPQLSFDPGTPVLGMYGAGLGATDPNMMLPQNASTSSLNNLLANANGAFGSHTAADTQRRSVDLGEMAHRRGNFTLTGPVPALFSLQASSRAGSGGPGALYQRDVSFSGNGQTNGVGAHGVMGAMNPSSAAHQAAALLLNGGHRSRGVASHGRMVRPTQQFAPSMFHGSQDASGLLPGQLAKLGALNLQQRSAATSARSSLDLQPTIIRAPGDEPRRYSVDIAGQYAPAIQTALPTAEAALIAGPDAYSRVGALTGYPGLATRDTDFVNGYGYQSLIDPSSLHAGNASYANDHTGYSMPVTGSMSMGSFHGELGMDAREAASGGRANGSSHMNGSAGSPGPKVADRAGVNYGLGALQALQQLSLQEAVKRADSFEQILKDLPQCESGLRETGLRFEEAAINSSAG
eukprot:jgi/Botrbrau1/7478/Bobra.0095s0016.1